jgi:hypothetical protein
LRVGHGAEDKHHCHEISKKENLQVPSWIYSQWNNNNNNNSLKCGAEHRL